MNTRDLLNSTLQSWLGLPRERIRDLLYPLLSIRGLHLHHKAACLRALDIYAATHLNFEDTLLIALAELEDE